MWKPLRGAVVDFMKHGSASQSGREEGTGHSRLYLCGNELIQIPGCGHDDPFARGLVARLGVNL